MGRRWSDKREFFKLSSELAASSGEQFIRCVLPLLRTIWPNLVEASTGYSQVDFLVWAESGPLPVAIQVISFLAAEQELDDTHIAVCKSRIQAFAISCIQTDTYVFVHNRDGRNASFRTELEGELAALEASGQVGTAWLWDRHRLLTEAFIALAHYIRDRMAHLGDGYVTKYSEIEPALCEPLAEVPLLTYALEADQYQMKHISQPFATLSDPSYELVKQGRGRCVLLLGEFGLGKTTVALRALQQQGSTLLYMPGAAISPATSGAKDLISQCVDIDALLADFSEPDRPVLARMTRPILERLFTNQLTSAVLLFDGLDESFYLSHRGGLQWFLNLLRPISIPVVLTMRAEYWRTHLADFSASFGLRAKDDRIDNLLRYYTVVELAPWTNAQIGQLARRYRNSLTEVQAQVYLDNLINLIDTDTYSQLYGDIPRRPLFLRIILETVAAQGARQTGRARLLHEWTIFKVLRDIMRPRHLGGQGRPPISSSQESTAETVELALLAMEAAAAQMVARDGNGIDLLPDCPLEQALASEPRLRTMANNIQILLHSLLIPAKDHLPGEVLSVRFAHRAFQEYFLARHTLHHPEVFSHCIWPEAIAGWRTSLIIEGVIVESIELTQKRATAQSFIHELEAIPVGTRSAGRYHELIFRVMVRLFSPLLDQPVKEQELHQGRKRIDIVFNNRAERGFFYNIRVQHGIPSPYIFVECKNYTEDPGNPEFDQLIGRLSTKRGMFGMLLCRSLKNRDTVLKRCRDAVNDSRGYVLVFMDDDIKALLNLWANDQQQKMDDFLDDHLRQLLL